VLDTALRAAPPTEPATHGRFTVTTESGVEAGVTYAPEVGLLGVGPTVKIEGAGLHVDVYRELLGAA